MPRHDNPWAAEDEALLRALWNARELSVERIAGRLGRTKRAVASKAARLHLPRKTGDRRVSCGPTPVAFPLERRLVSDWVVEDGVMSRTVIG